MLHTEMKGLRFQLQPRESSHIQGMSKGCMDRAIYIRKHSMANKFATLYAKILTMAVVDRLAAWQ